MKTFRVCLLLLLAVLLPLRGALAAGMLCPDGASSHHVQSQASAHANHHEHAAHAGHAAEHGSTHDHGGTAKCNVCSAFCSVPAIASTSLQVASCEPAAAVFPRLHAPPVSFISGGQERPPRST